MSKKWEKFLKKTYCKPVWAGKNQINSLNNYLVPAGTVGCQIANDILGIDGGCLNTCVNNECTPTDPG